MFFTQEDYKKIQTWLNQNAIKDSEFKEASLPLNEYDIISFVQNGNNVKVRLKDFLEQLFLLREFSDFINVTDKYKAKYILLKQAIQLVPYKTRKIGQVITFLNEEKEWKIYQFKGESVNQWNEESLWEDIIKAIQGSDLVADEEDLTEVVDEVSGKSLLKLKDKTYDPDNFSGLGRVILRKNIVTILNSDTQEGQDINLLTQQMINKPNTIYEIQYDFDLNNQEITIPEGCVLDFKGGSLSNGILNGNNTNIQSYPIFILHNIKIKGNYSIEKVYAEWFGAIGNGVTDDTKAIQQTLNYFCSVYLCDNKNYLIKNTIYLKYKRIINGGKNTNIIINGETSLFKLGHSSCISNINIKSNKVQSIIDIDVKYVISSFYEENNENTESIRRSASNINIENVNVIIFNYNNDLDNNINCINIYNNGIEEGIWQININNINIFGLYNYIVHIDNNIKNSFITDLNFSNIKIDYAKNGIYINGNNIEHIKFNNVSMQYRNNITKLFANIEQCDNVIFTYCQPWDFGYDAYFINPNKVKNCNINNVRGHLKTTNVKLTESITNLGHSPSVNSADGNMFNGSYSIEYFFNEEELNNIMTIRQLNTLIDGSYIIPPNSKYNKFLNIDVDYTSIGNFKSNLIINRQANGYTLLILYFIFRKGIQGIAYSIIQNVDNLDVPIPKFIIIPSKIEEYQSKEDLLNDRAWVGKNSQAFIRENSISSLVFIRNNKIFDTLGREYSILQGDIVPNIENTNYNIGKDFYRISDKKPYYFNNNAWFDSNGNLIDSLKQGTTQQRPTDVKAGFYYFDTTLNKPIWKKDDTTNVWIDAMGAEV